MIGNKQLQGRNAVVTGGAQGIGQAIVERLNADGASVCIWDIDHWRNMSRKSLVVIHQ